MSKYQAKLTLDELQAALNKVATDVACYGITEERAERFSYLAKRILAIKENKPEINEPEQTENPAPKNDGWGKD